MPLINYDDIVAATPDWSKYLSQLIEAANNKKLEVSATNDALFVRSTEKDGVFLKIKLNGQIIIAETGEEMSLGAQMAMALYGGQYCE